MTILQSIIWPEECYPERTPLYCGEGWQPGMADSGILRLPARTRLSLHTQVNALCLRAWKTYTLACNFRARLHIQGRAIVEMTLWNIPTNEAEAGPVAVFRHEVEGTVEVPVPAASEADWVSLSIQTLDDAVDIHNAAWVADGEDRSEQIRLAVVICSCFREEMTRLKVAEMGAYLEEDSPVTVFVVDNGATLKQEDFGPYVRLIVNPNTGGAGGFTRGLIEALEACDLPGPATLPSHYTHVLFSDDDAFFGPDALHRTLTLLGMVKPEYAKARISGAMMITEHPTRQHASREWRKDKGAPLPRRHSVDLANWDKVLRHGVDFDELPRAWVYGAWWYCAFPIGPEIANDLPLPLFFRFDDIEYGVRFSRRGGKWMNLNGICCFHPAFSGKAGSAVREYFNTRNGYIFRAVNNRKYPYNILQVIHGLYSFQYTIAVARFLAWRDFVQGPSMLDGKPDIAALQVRLEGQKESFGKKVRLLALSLVFTIKDNLGRQQLTKRWQHAFPRLTGMEFWKRYLGMDNDESLEKR